ncbi:MAG: alginate lyase family protein [Chloroflexi bacterium]|nr:alginate lyase family protein [Chloroflexota bacterium]
MKTSFLKSISLITFSVISILIFSQSALAQTSFVHPNSYLNQSEITAIKTKVQNSESPWKSAYDNLISEANSALNQSILSVTKQGKTLASGDKHDYSTDKPYSSDGVFNPNADRADYKTAITFGKVMRALGLAYAFTQDTRYAQKGLELAKAWMVTPETKMNPRFPNNQSRIEISITIPGAIYGLDLLWNYPGWSASDKTAIKQWVQDLATASNSWGKTSGNNIYSWRLVLVSTAGVVAENAQMLNQAFSDWKLLLASQLDSQNRFKNELSRTNSLSYSTYAMNAMVQVAEIARHYRVNLYEYQLSGNRSLEKALDYHAPYVANPSSWPNQQITPYSGDNAALYELAYLFKQKSSYLQVIQKWERPMSEIRVMGPVTLTHAFGAYPWGIIGSQIPTGTPASVW